MLTKKIFLLIIFVCSAFNIYSQNLINITNYPDTITANDSIEIVVRSVVRDNGSPASPLTSVIDTLYNDKLTFDLTFDFTGPWINGWTRIDTIHYSNTQINDSLLIICYYNAVDSIPNPPVSYIRHDTDSVVIHIRNTTNLKEISNHSSLIIYPNPSEGQFVIQTENANFGSYDLKIFNLQGKIVHENNINIRRQTALNLSHLQKGVYFIALQNENESIVEKVIMR